MKGNEKKKGMPPRMYEFLHLAPPPLFRRDIPLSPSLVFQPPPPLPDNYCTVPKQKCTD